MNNDRPLSMPNATPISRRAFLRRVFVDTCALTLAACGFHTNGEQALAQPLPADISASIAARNNPNASPSVADENRLPGTTEWELRHLLDDIEGFASATSINQGESIDFYVNTSASTFDITIFRSGYYGGMGGRQIKVINNLPGKSQPAAYNEPNTGLASCSNWSPSYRLETDAEWVSGIYIAKLLRHDTGGENHIYFVVRDDARGADILYQQSITTYHAYNNYGGKSLYNFNSSHCNTISEEQRAVKVGVKRPYTRVNDPLFYNRYLNVEYPLVSWLEAQGYDLSYSTNLDTHHSGAVGAENQLLKHRVFISAGHDEYWSQEMRNAVTAARDAGVNLCFLGSNTCYWRIRFEADPVTHEPDAVIVCYKTTQSGPSDPSGHATSTWRDPIGANAPENALVGVQYIGDHDSSFFPLRVTAETSQHPLYRNTGLEHIAADSYVDIGQKLIGWEWDAVVDNGHSPLGLEIVAASPVFGNLLTDAGHIYDLRQASVHATRYTAQSGALVFASATNHWPWGLAIIEPDPRIQQITYNVLSDMGVQPMTPAPTLVLDSAASPHAIAPTTARKFPSGPAPTISNLQAAASSNSATFTWETDIAAKGQIWLGDSAEYTSTAPYTSEEQFSLAHTTTLMYLDPEKIYYYRAAVTDEYGRTVFSSVGQFETQRASAAGQAKILLKRLAASPLACWVETNRYLSMAMGSGAVIVGGAGWLLRRMANVPKADAPAADLKSEDGT
jgi:hypothetical protein